MEGTSDLRAGRLDRLCRAALIEQTIRQKLAEGFQRAEFVLEGFVDMICDRRDLTDRIAGLLKLHRREAQE